jgi:hypothetical protein
MRKEESFQGQTHFKCNNYLPPSKAGKHASHMGISGRGDTAFPEDVAIGRVESG